MKIDEVSSPRVPPSEPGAQGPKSCLLPINHARRGEVPDNSEQESTWHHHCKNRLYIVKKQDDSQSHTGLQTTCDGDMGFSQEANTALACARNLNRSNLPELSDRDGDNKRVPWKLQSHLCHTFLTT
jgi:hypothetical protein